MAFGGPFFSVRLTESDVPGASLDGRACGECTVTQLQRWLECRGLKTSGTKPELIRRSVHCSVVE